VSCLLLLLPTAAYRARDFLDAAAALGAEVVVASEQRQALAGVMGSWALRVSLGRPEAAAQAIVALAERTPLDAVVAVDDQVSSSRARCRAPRPRAQPVRAVAAARDRAAMRRAFAAAGVPQPEYGSRAAGMTLPLAPRSAFLRR
jgi:biotin carboxylase